MRSFIKGKRNKYKVAGKADRTADGIVFASKREMNRYLELKLQEKAGAIRDLELQPRFDIRVNGKFCGFYKADFRYTLTSTGERKVEDVKGMPTPVYRLKKKLIEAMHGIEIIEV